MSFWSKETWKELKRPKYPILPFKEAHIDDSGYRLSVGDEIVRTTANGQTVQKLQLNETVFLEPGQFAFILTDEFLDLPLDVIGFISVRASIKFFGLVNVSGFHVDPGYRGKLIFAVFNAGPTRIPLRRGQEIFSIWLANLDRANPESARPKPGYDHIPPDVVAKIGDGHLTAYQLSTRIDKLEALVSDLKVWRNVLTTILAAIVSLGLAFVGGIGVEYAKETWFLSADAPPLNPLTTP